MRKCVPLGDQAVLAYFDDEQLALHFAQQVRITNLYWLIDVVSAYSSVAVFYDQQRVSYAEAASALAAVELSTKQLSTDQESPLHQIPCCYEHQRDLMRVAKRTDLDPEVVIRLHSATVYRVYAIGFCPGFPYLGYLPDSLCNVPRLDTPRLRLEAGSIGMTGRQSGIYTEPRPGGWNIIGQTPLELVNVSDGYFPLQAGDRVRFVRIDESEFQRRRGERLSKCDRTAIK